MNTPKSIMYRGAKYVLASDEPVGQIQLGKLVKILLKELKKVGFKTDGGLKSDGVEIGLDTPVDRRDNYYHVTAGWNGMFVLNSLSSKGKFARGLVMDKDPATFAKKVKSYLKQLGVK